MTNDLMPDPFLTGRGPWQPNHAVAALIQIVDGRYVLQLRDPKPEIFYPDHWGCFGGAIEPGERDEEALMRELREELGLSLADGARRASPLSLMISASPAWACSGESISRFGSLPLICPPCNWRGGRYRGLRRRRGVRAPAVNAL